VKGNVEVSWILKAASSAQLQLFDIDFSQTYDGSADTLYNFTIDTVFNTLDAASKIDSITTVRTDSCMHIYFWCPNSGNTLRFTGMISGHGVGGAITRRKL